MRDWYLLSIGELNVPCQLATKKRDGSQLPDSLV